MDGRRDDGFTLVEVLVAVAIMGIAFTALLGGMATSAKTSDINRKQALTSALLNQAAESVKDDNRNPYDNATCAAATVTYNPYTGVTLPPGWGLGPSYAPIVVNGVEYRTATGWSSTCVTGQRQDLQRVTLTVTSPDGRATEKVAVVKRAP